MGTEKPVLISRVIENESFPGKLFTGLRFVMYLKSAAIAVKFDDENPAIDTGMRERRD